VVLQSRGTRPLPCPGPGCLPLTGIAWSGRGHL